MKALNPLVAAILANEAVTKDSDVTSPDLTFCASSETVAIRFYFDHFMM